MMKQSLGILVILGLSFSLQAETYLKPPAAPVYENCGSITVSGRGGTQQVPDQACKDRNAEKQRNYSAADEVYNRSTRMMSADASTLVKPAEPVYEKCATNQVGGGGYNVDYACQQRNQQKQHDYNIQITGWNKMQQEEALNNQAEHSEEKRKALAEAQAQSATESLRKAQEQNQKSAKSSNKAATITMGLSIAAGVKFAMSCAGVATCNYGWLAASIGFGMMSSKNSRQASQNYASATASCQAQAQLNSSARSDCSAIANSPVGPTPLVPGVFNTNAECVASDKSICDRIIAELPTGTNIKDIVKGANTFAMTPPFKTNPDGSVTTKDGKTFKPSDFTSKEALMAAGLSADQAGSAMGSLAKAGLGTPDSGLDKAKEDLADSKKIDFGGTAISGSGSESGEILASEASGAISSGAISGSTSANGRDRLGKRIPAGEGLTRNFNGESIGAAGDDIFSMMNRRYKTKIAQDSFIGN